MNAVGRLRRRTAALADGWRQLRQDIDEELLDVAEDIEEMWRALVVLAVVTAVIVVGLCRLVLSRTVGARPAIAVPFVALVCAAAVVCVVGLAWVDRRNRRRSEREGVRFVVGVGVSLIAIGICIEALAGVTTVLWRHDLIDGPAGIAPSLWRSEEYYLWNLVSWIPLVDITEGLRWREPTLFQDSLSGALLFGLKVLLVAPLLRIGIGAYRWVTARLLEDESKWLHKQELRRLATEDESEAPEYLATDETGRLPWLVVIALAAYPIAAAAVMPLIFEPGQHLDRWWTQRLEEVGAMFLRTAPQWLGVVVLVGTIGSVLEELWDRYLWVRDRQALAQALVSYAALVGLALVTAAALNLALLHADVAAAQPEIPAGGHVRAALEAHLWNLADVPGWDLPNALRWSPTYAFADGWSAALLLVVRLFLVGVLVVPVAQAVMSYAHFRLRRPAKTTGLDAVTRFGRRFHDARVAIDRAGDAAGTRRVLAVGEVHLGNAAIHAMELVTDELDSIRQLFGAGEIAHRADAAVATLLHRLDTMRTLETARFLDRDVDAVEREFARLREEEQVRYERYQNAVRAALSRSAEAV